MKPTILTPAILMAATLFAATAAHAQSAAAPKAYPPGPSAQAWPPGPTAEAYPPGPSGQAAAQTTNVNVVNAPTVQVGNEVTVKEPVRTPLYVQKEVTMNPGAENASSVKIEALPGTRMVVETVNMLCWSSVAQAVGALLFKPGIGYAVVSLFPQPVAWSTGTMSSQVAQVHLLVDDYLSVSAQRSTGNGYTTCAVTLSGYTTPLP